MARVRVWALVQKPRMGGWGDPRLKACWKNLEISGKVGRLWWDNLGACRTLEEFPDLGSVFSKKIPEQTQTWFSTLKPGPIDRDWFNTHNDISTRNHQQKVILDSMDLESKNISPMDYNGFFGFYGFCDKYFQFSGLYSLESIWIHGCSRIHVRSRIQCERSIIHGHSRIHGRSRIHVRSRIQRERSRIHGPSRIQRKRSKIHKSSEWS